MAADDTYEYALKALEQDHANVHLRAIIAEANLRTARQEVAELKKQLAALQPEPDTAQPEE